MRHNNGNSSNVKFGSWDQTGMSPGASLTTLRTSNNYRWSLAADDYAISGAKFLVGQDREITYSPHLPYLYLPAKDWEAFADAMATAYPDLRCIYSENRCFWNVACSSIPS